MDTMPQRFGAPIRVGLAGTRFGQFYAEAIRRHPRYELVAIAARGSQRSRRVAEYYGVPLVDSLLEAPGGIDLACVAVSSQVMGGPGSQIAHELLGSGIHVLMEQPIHHRDITECVKVARCHEVSFQIGDLYLQLPRVRQFVEMARRLCELERASSLFLEFSNMVSFPVAHVLGELAGGAGPCRFQSVPRSPEDPFVVVSGQVVGMPVDMVVHNVSNPEVSDADMPLLFGITASFRSGRLTLRDPHGHIEWHPTLALPRDRMIPAGLRNDPSPVLETPMTMVLGNQVPTLTHALDQQWVRAVQRDLDDWRTGTGRQKAARLQKVFGAAQLWAEMTQRIGMPTPGTVSPSARISHREVSLIHDMTMSWEERLATLDARSIAECVEALDKAADLSMLACLASHIDVGRWQERDAVAAAVPVSPAMAHIPRRWVKSLLEEGLLLENAGMVRAVIPTDDGGRELAASARRAWDRAALLWSHRLGAPEVVAYMGSHVAHFDDLMTGRIQAKDLLFVEGGTGLAHALYRQTLIAQALNRDIAARVVDLAAHSDHPLSILEIGAGTGATCDQVLAAIDDLDPAALGQYHYTDISPFFFTEARARLHGDPRVVMETLDIERPGSFLTEHLGRHDLVIAAGVLNNVSDTVEVINRSAAMLVEGGRMIISEAFEETPLMLVTQAFMMNPATDLRAETDGMFLTHDQWCRTFEQAGMSLVAQWPTDGHRLRPLGQRVYVLERSPDHDMRRP